MMLVKNLIRINQDKNFRANDKKYCFFGKVCVKMKNLENGTEFIWPKEKFLNRLYLMKEMYNNYEEEEDDWDLPEV